MFRAATRCLLFVGGLSLLPLAVSAADREGQDWPSWRGPQRDGISRETGLLKKWGESGPPLLWRAEGLGKGFSSVAISDGRIFSMGERKGGAWLIALDQRDGKELWAAELGLGNPNCTPTVDGDLVYGLGRQGDLICVRADSGDVVWKKNFGRDFGGKMMSGWGYSESPLVDGDALVCTPGALDAMLVSLDKRTGETNWKAALPEVGNRGKDGAGYSSIVISEGAGVRQYVQVYGRGALGVDAETGEILWTYNRIANGTANIPTPIVDGDFVFCSTGYGTGAALLELIRDGNGIEAKEVYFLDAKTLQNHHGGMVLLDGYLYGGHGHNQGFPICVDFKSGEVK